MDEKRGSAFPEGGVLETPKKTLFQENWSLFRKNRLAMAGLIIFVIFFIIAAASVFLTGGRDPIFNPATVRLQEKLRPPLSKPNLETLKPGELPTLGIYLFGTDDLGRDVFSRMLQGSWVSLTVGFVAVGIAVVIGVILGGIAGYYGNERIQLGHLLCPILLGGGLARLVSGKTGLGLFLLLLGVGVGAVVVWMGDSRNQHRGPGGLSVLFLNLFSVDVLITGLIDIMLCFPSFFLILTVVALLPASIYNIMAVIGLTSWMGAARFVRAEFLSLREQDFVTAARALGVSDWRIIFRHMVPNAIAPVLVSATIGIATAILTEAGLSFLGFGVPPPDATWGNILSNGKNFLFDAPWLTFVPGLAILVVVLAFNLFGEGLRDVLNPKLKERH
ncbi:MAG: ABC transporter permease [Thermodesulfobacteriota bacterium]